MDCWLKDNCKQLHCDDENGCLILYKLNYLCNEAFISEKLRKDVTLRVEDNPAYSDLSAFMQLKAIQGNILDFVANGDNLYIHSQNAGNGKTSWSIKLVKEYFKKIWYSTALTCRALFINVPRYLQAIKSVMNPSAPELTKEYVNKINENIFKADVVIWDDIGTKSATSFEHETLYSLIDTRINLGKSNIYTSNLTDEELHNTLGDRLASRISGSTYNFTFKGGDKRGLTEEEIINGTRTNN